jgi:putative transposase
VRSLGGEREGYGMEKTTSPQSQVREADISAEFLSLSDTLSEHLRGKIAELIAGLVDAQIGDVVGADRYAHETRGGYRHGHRTRAITTGFGRADVLLPRARVFTSDGRTREFRSELIRSYRRRSAEVDGSILGSYLAGVNTRRVEKALEPMLKGAPLTKSSVSRVVKELARSFAKWRTRSLADHHIAYLFLDAIVVRVKVDRRSHEMAVLVGLGVHESGERELLGIRLVATESGPAWKEFIEELSSRDLRAPALCVIDGHAGLRKAIASAWPGTAVQRCAVHKLRNLQAHCPKALWPELHADFAAIVEAPSKAAARKAHKRFLRVWQHRCPAVVESLLEAGEELLTHYDFPPTQWRALRTTNAIERLNLEFRRRIKTQGSLPNEQSVLTLFYGLWASGQIRLRRIDGWREQELMLASKRGPGPSGGVAQTETVSSAGEENSERLRKAA